METFFVMQGLPVETDQSLTGPYQAGDTAKQGRLTAAVGSIKAYPLPGGQGERDILQNTARSTRTRIGHLHLFQTENIFLNAHRPAHRMIPPASNHRIQARQNTVASAKYTSTGRRQKLSSE